MKTHSSVEAADAGVMLNGLVNAGGEYSLSEPRLATDLLPEKYSRVLWPKFPFLQFHLSDFYWMVHFL